MPITAGTDKSSNLPRQLITRAEVKIEGYF